MEPETRSAGDGELAARARRGDLGAFDELVRRHEAAAIRIASVVGGSQGAEDAAQEGFVRAFRALDRFDTSREFRPWLLRIVANAAKNRVRADRRQTQLRVRQFALRTVPLETEDDDTSDTVVAAERREAVAAAVARLPVQDRIVIAYRWFEDMTEREMALALDVRAGTVKSRLSRAMARLRVELERSEVTVD
jgi:RNA polymerase sigma factor (sigma-70 family)